jgi:hypothetical protein
VVLSYSYCCGTAKHLVYSDKSRARCCIYCLDIWHMAFPHAAGTIAKMPDRIHVMVRVLSEHSLSKHIRATTLAATPAAMTQAAMLGDDTTIKRSYTSGSDNHTTFVNQNHSCGCIVRIPSSWPSSLMRWLLNHSSWLHRPLILSAFSTCHQKFATRSTNKSSARRYS